VKLTKLWKTWERVSLFVVLLAWGNLQSLSLFHLEWQFKHFASKKKKRIYFTMRCSLDHVWVFYNNFSNSKSIWILKHTWPSGFQYRIIDIHYNC
jgi:hypothetical protein